MPRIHDLPFLVLLCIATSACDEQSAHDAVLGERCFPVPSDAEFRAVRPGERDQGTSLQGGPRPGRENQGTSLQGAGRPDRENNGRSQQGGPVPGEKDQGRFLGIGDLAGVALVLADGDVPVTLEEGQLRAPGHPTTASLIGVALRATTADGRELGVQIVERTAIGLGDRISLTVEGEQVCNDGDLGVFVAGSWNDAGDHIDDANLLTFACDDGVIAKCVSWGYAPWSVGADVHQACTRLARADYCGDGTPWTLDGTIIDVYDALGVQEMVPDPELHFEAAWGPDGAVCVAQTRYDVSDEDGRHPLPSCSDQLPTCRRLEDLAASSALLADRSAHTPIAACD